MYWLKPKALFDGDILHNNMAIKVEDNYVSEISNIKNIPKTELMKNRSEILSLGFFDVQVNGGGGTMLNNDPTPLGVEKIAAAHRSCGTPFILPTVITDKLEITQQAADAVIKTFGTNGVMGIHIEGPHINKEKKGTHNPNLIRPFDDDTMEILKKLRHHNVPTLLTLAPECVERGLIKKLSQMGVKISAGHSAANAEQTENAIKEGLTCFTHLFNAMPPMLGRDPGLVGSAINSPLWCGIITDGHHVNDAMIRLAVQARPTANRMVVVSDAMSTVGGPDQFELYGEIIKVSNGKLVNKNGDLAGAHIDMVQSVKRLINEIKIDPIDSLKMATTNPRDLMGLPQQNLIGSHIEELTFL